MSILLLISIYGLIILVILVILVMMISYDRRPPVIEPFTRQFFNQIVKTHFIGIDQPQLFGNELDLIETIRHLMPFNINTLLVEQSMDRYRHLNDDKIQLVLSRSNEIYDLIYKLTPTSAHLETQEIRLVCALYGVPINILSTVLEIGELGQLKNSKLTVNVGPKDSSDYFIAMDLFFQYRIGIGADICVTYYDVNDLLIHYGQDVHIAIMARTHPDKTIVNLTNKKMTRLTEILKYNNGNVYHMSLEEEPFYRRFPYYTKNITEKTKLAEYYPNLSLNEDIFDQQPHQPLDSYKSRFINTISVRYYLLSNTMTDRWSIGQLLYHLKLNMNALNQLNFIDDYINTASFTDFRLPMLVHQGARDFYESTGLYTNIDQFGCIMINGRCDMKQLREHHLVHNFGPTFDQMYNR